MAKDGELLQLWTKSGLAQEFQMDKKKVTRLMKGVAPDGKTHRGYDGYYLMTAVPILFELDAEEDDDGPVDPDSLEPKARKDWYEGTKTKQALELAAGQLVTLSEHRRSLAVFATSVVAGFENLPDIAERDFGLPPEVVQLTQDAVDRARALAHELVTDSIDQ